MSEIDNADNANSVDDQTPPPSETPPSPQPNESEAFKRLQADLFKERQERKKIQDELESQRIKDLEKKQKWEEIAKIREQERDEFKKNYDGLLGSLVSEKKFSALKDAGLKAGIRPEALPDLELLDFDEVTIEHSSSGKIIISGASQAISNLKTLKPHWFTSKPATVNSNSPTAFEPPASQGAVNLKMITDAEAKFKKSGSMDDRKAYESLILKYKAQNN